jgi:adenine specific DNA methylase Mod/very-short-patch-repair endonuclease
MSDNQAKFQNLLRELFQFDCADLDFGIYRIMNTKREEIVRFLDRDLLPQVREAFHAYEAENRGAVEAELAEAIEKARELGADPETLPRVKDLRAKLAQAVDVTALENEVYSHLYNFFRRYYSEGDFISLRRYKDGVYAIPYEGEEVKLYWANHDQYYIKTSEYLRNYTFKLPSGKRVHFKLVEADTEKDNNRPQNGKERRFILSEKQPLEEENGELVIRFEYRPDLEKRKQTDLNAAAVERILFMITNSPGLLKEWSSLLEKRPTEKNPNRTLLEKHLTDYTARNTFDYFIHKNLGGFLRRELDFYIKNEVMHLDDIESETAPRVEQYLSKIKAIRRIAHKIIDFLAQLENFQKKLWLKKKFVVETHYCVTLDRVPEELYQEIAANDAQREEWVRLFAIDKLEDSPLPFGERVEGEGQTQIKSRTKEERSALIKLFAREMRHAPTDAEQRLWYFLRDRRLGGYKFRRQHPVGNYIADFACIEGRLIVELDGGQHAEIFQQEKDEVKTAFFTERGFRVLRFWNHQVLNDTQAVLEEILRVLEESPHPNPLPFGEREMAFLKANPYLVLDTRHFSEDFKRRLLASFDDLDEQCDGLLIHSENFQALNLLMERYRGQVKCVYVDPPYNTGNDGFPYKDTYQHSSWLTMFESRAAISRHLLADSGVMFFSIDEIECPRSWLLTSQLFGETNFASEIIWEKKKKPSFLHRNIGKLTDFILAFNKNAEASPPFSVETTTADKLTPLNNAGNQLGVLCFPPNTVLFGCPDGLYRAQDMSGGNIITRLLDDVIVRNGTNANTFRLEGEFRYSQAKLDQVIASGDKLYISKVPFRPNHIKRGGEIKKMKNLLSPSHYSMETNEDASQQLVDLFGREVFDNPKPEKLIRYLVLSVTHSEVEALIVDFFAGSGTTAHAVINLNREDGGQRKYILVEMGEYFDTVLVPRIKKVVYSKDWKDGKPLTPTLSPEGRGQGEGTGISHMFKYIRLESYEDTLNNLELKRTEAQQSILEQHPAFREDYMLHYMLDVESRGSASLLNLDRFEDPFSYKLNIATGTVGETKPTVVDLVETFNYLIGLRVKTIRYIDGVCVVTGTNPQGERVLILWRNIKETDNDKLDDWFQKQGYNTKDQEYDVIYVNGDNNLENLKKPDQTWKVRLIEEEFLRRMFDVQDV